MQTLKQTALSLLIFASLVLTCQAGTLDDYYLQQFGEQPVTALKSSSISTVEQLEVRCGMPLKHDLRRDWDKLEPSTQTVLAKQLAVPVLAGEATLSSAHFVIHYATTGTDVPTPASPYTVATWVQQVADTFESAYTAYQVTYGYRPPPVVPYHVYLRSLAALRIYGQTTTSTPAPSAGYPSAYNSFIEIDKDFTNPIFTNNAVPLQSLQITSSHEFHHAIQFGYNVFFDVWYAEATSQWYEGELYPLIRQLYGYVPGWFSNSTKRLDLAVDASALDTGAGYGRWIFNRYLAELHSPDIVRTFWQNLASIPSPDGSSDIPMLPVINTTLTGALPTDFLGFARRVYRQNEWPLAYDKTSTHLLYKPFATYLGYPVNSLSLPKPEVFLEQYSFAYYRFAIPATSALTLYVNGTPDIVARAFRKDSAGNITEFSFPTTYPSSVSIPNANMASEIVLLLVNTSGNTTQNANFSTDGTLLATAPVTPTTGFTLTVTIPATATGVGSGQVTSDSGGISCSSGGSGVCSAVFPVSSPVTLTATTAMDSTFTGWSGDCSGLASCILTMIMNRNVSAHFGVGPNNEGPKAKIESTGYNSINDAYSAAGSNTTILTTAGTQTISTLVMDQNKYVFLKGGYNPFFTYLTGQPTVMQGALFIKSGSVRADGVVIREATNVCGDMNITETEQCDDGNVINGDGCSSTCQVESDFICSGSPSSCIRIASGSLAADWCVINWPSSTSSQAGTTTEFIYGQVYETGMTENAGANPDIKAQLGLGPIGTSPITQPEGWNYFNATFNAQIGGNDEYRAQLPTPLPGTYSYVYRFSLDNGASYTFCDLGAGTADGFSSTQLGVLTATP